MSRKRHPIVNNLLLNKSDLAEAVRQLCDPLLPYYSPGGALLDIGDTYSRASLRVAQMEGNLRPLWGLAPFLSGGESWQGWNIYIKGLRHGPNAEHEEFWGNIGHCEQRQVELASIALTLLFAPE